MNSKLESLIEGCRRREPRAQRELYDKLAPAMLAVCQRYMKDREAAKDVMQDGFVRLFEKIGSYKGEGSFEGWARRLFVNTALMQLRRNDALKDSDNIEDSQAMQMTHSNTLENPESDAEKPHRKSHRIHIQDILQAFTLSSGRALPAGQQPHREQHQADSRRQEELPVLQE